MRPRFARPLTSKRNDKLSRPRANRGRRAKAPDRKKSALKLKTIITGSSGFIGTHLVASLLTAGETVLGLDIQPPRQGAQKAVFRNVDLMDASALKKVFADFQPDAVVHLAARTDLDEKKDLQGYALNIKGVENLWDAVAATPGVKRCVVTSSQLVCRVGHVPSSPTEYNPNNLYGESKVLTEKITRERDGAGREWCLVRPTTVWGPGMSPHYQTFFGMIRRGRYFHVGRRPLRKTYGYVGNVVIQYERLLKAPAPRIHRQTIYVGDYEPISLRQWADAFQTALNAPPIRTLPEPLARLAARTGDLVKLLTKRRFPFDSFRLNNVLTEYVYDMSPTREICGELPFSMSAGVAQTVAWLNSQAPCHPIA